MMLAAGGALDRAEGAGSAGRRPRAASVVFWLLLAAASLAAGCGSPPRLARVNLADPGWQVRQGQAVWRAGAKRPELAGELVVASHRDGRSLVEFSKTPFPFVAAQWDADRWSIEFPPRNLAFGGRGKAPVRFGWLLVCRALSGEALPTPWRFTTGPDGRWRLANPRTGESLEGVLTP